MVCDHWLPPSQRCMSLGDPANGRTATMKERRRENCASTEVQTSDTHEKGDKTSVKVDLWRRSGTVRLGKALRRPTCV